MICHWKPTNSNYLTTMHRKHAFCRAAVCWQIASCASDRICATRCSVSVESRLLLDAVLPIHSKHIILFLKTSFTGHYVTNLDVSQGNNTHTHTHLTALFPGLPRWAGTRKVKPIWILLKQEAVSGGGISWAICKSAPRSRQTTTPAPHHSIFFTGWMPFLPPNQQRQCTEGNNK